MLKKFFGYSFSEPPPRLGVFFGPTEIAELTIEDGQYVFRYLPGFKSVNLSPLPGFTDVAKVYRSPQLWPFFRERIPDPRRPEIHELMQREGLTDASELELLGRLGARAITDPFEFRLLKVA